MELHLTDTITNIGTNNYALSKYNMRYILIEVGKKINNKPAYLPTLRKKGKFTSNQLKNLRSKN